MSVLPDSLEVDRTGGCDAEFSTRAEPCLRELLARCYRMTGWVHDAENPVQETTLIHQQDPAGVPCVPDGCHHRPFQLHVLDMGSVGISHAVGFFDITRSVKFVLPESL